MRIVALDNSMFRIIADCSTETALVSMRRRSLRPNGALQVGTLVHSLLARHLKGVDPTDSLHLFEVEYQDQVGLFGGWLFGEAHLTEKPQYAMRNLSRIAREWMARHPQPNPFQLHIPPEWVEISFELPLREFTVAGEKYLLVITGQLDALGEEGDDLYTVEHKTHAGRIAGWWMDKFESDSQNTEYQWAAETTTGREVLGTYLNAIGTGTIPDSDRTCYTHTYADIPEVKERLNLKTRKERPLYSECGHLHAEMEVFLVTRNAALLEQWKDDAVELATRYVLLQRTIAKGIIGATETRTEGKFHDVCMFCDFRNWCIRSARNPQMAEQMMGKNEEVRDVRTGIFEEEEFYAEQRIKTGFDPGCVVR